MFSPFGAVLTPGQRICIPGRRDECSGNCAQQLSSVQTNCPQSRPSAAVFVTEQPGNNYNGGDPPLQQHCTRQGQQSIRRNSLTIAGDVSHRCWVGPSTACRRPRPATAARWVPAPSRAGSRRCAGRRRGRPPPPALASRAPDPVAGPGSALSRREGRAWERQAERAGTGGASGGCGAGWRGRDWGR